MNNIKNLIEKIKEQNGSDCFQVLLKGIDVDTNLTLEKKIGIEHCGEFEKEKFIVGKMLDFARKLTENRTKYE